MRTQKYQRSTLEDQSKWGSEMNDELNKENQWKHYDQYKNNQCKWVKTKVKNQVFQLPDYYQVIKPIAAGGYGMVALCKDTRVKQQGRQNVAIKKMTNVFQNDIYSLRILRQLKMLRLLKHQNIVETREIILPKSRAQFNGIYIVFTLMEYDLTSLIRSEIKFTEQHLKYYLYQILIGLKYIHSAGIVHRDLKPRNILVGDSNQIEICDFGMARFLGEEKYQDMTAYVTTRWYRAPEILLGSPIYSTSVDMWSLGCIFAEFQTRKTFLKAQSTKDQLSLIMQSLGVDPITITEKNCIHLSPIKVTQKINFKKDFPNLSPDGTDLLQKMLKFNPKERITAPQALKHPYFSKLHLQQDEPNCQEINKLEFQFEQYNLTMKQIKDLLYEEILLYHFKVFAQQHTKKIKKNQSVIQHIIKYTESDTKDHSTDISPA